MWPIAPPRVIGRWCEINPVGRPPRRTGRGSRMAASPPPPAGCPGPRTNPRTIPTTATKAHWPIHGWSSRRGRSIRCRGGSPSNAVSD